jgi:RimJ/RimL family protein N-acetyltransferase
MDVSLRPVKKKDIETIYSWRNRPEIREMMFDSRPISLEDHRAFWKKVLDDKTAMSFIITYGKEPVGVVRLEKNGNLYEVDIFLDPSAQGKGIGSEALRLAVEAAKGMGIRKLVAKIKKGNAASHKAFLKNNFKERYLYYERDVL